MHLLFIPLDRLTTPLWLIRTTWIMFPVRANLSAHCPFYRTCLCLGSEGIGIVGTASNLHVGYMAWLSPTQTKNSLLILSWRQNWSSETEEDEVEGLLFFFSHLIPSSTGDSGSIHSWFPNHSSMGLKGNMGHQVFAPCYCRLVNHFYCSLHKHVNHFFFFDLGSFKAPSCLASHALLTFT